MEAVELIIKFEYELKCRLKISKLLAINLFPVAPFRLPSGSSSARIQRLPWKFRRMRAINLVSPNFYKLPWISLPFGWLILIPCSVLRSSPKFRFGLYSKLSFQMLSVPGIKENPAKRRPPGQVLFLVDSVCVLLLFTRAWKSPRFGGLLRDFFNANVSWFDRTLNMVLFSHSQSGSYLLFIYKFPQL
jgi:hypothetical protein